MAGPVPPGSTATAPTGTVFPGFVEQRPGHRWWVLATIGVAQLMVVLDTTIVNIALPTAQHDLGFSTADRQWVITAYALSFGSLLLLGGRLSDLFGRKIAFMAGLVGFAVASAVGGAATSFGMLVAARAAQGAFGALLAPSALALLTTTFRDGRERGKAFGIFGAIAGGGAAIGLLLGGFLTEYLSWRWCMYVNLGFAVLALAGAAVLLPHQRRAPSGPRLDLPGAVAVSASLFCLVLGLSHAQTDGWSSPAAWGLMVAAVPLMVAFVVIQARTAHPLLPLRIVLDRNRGGAFLAVLTLGIGMFGIFLFLTYFLQQNLRFTPVRAGLAFLPMVVVLMTTAITATTVILPRTGPKPLVAVGLLGGAGGLIWLSRLGVHSTYAGGILAPLLVAGFGLGLTMSSSINTATRGVRPQEAGVASASVNALQQIGGSIGTALLSSIAGTATSNDLHGKRPTPIVLATAAVHGYTTAFLWAAGIFVGGAVVCGLILRAGPPPAVDEAVAPSEPALSAATVPWPYDVLIPALVLATVASQVERSGEQSAHLVAVTARLAPDGGPTDLDRARTAARRVLRPAAALALIAFLSDLEGRTWPPPSAPAPALALAEQA